VPKRKPRWVRWTLHAAGPVLSLPGVDTVARHAYRRLRGVAVARRMRNGVWFDPTRLLLVPPSRIRHAMVSQYDKWTDLGKVRDGDWDLARKPVDDLPVVRAFRDHFLHGVPWSRTEFYRGVVDSIRAGHPRWGCRTPEEYDRRCEALDALHAAITRGGYRTQAELAGSGATDGGPPPPPAVLDEVSVCIDRDGRFVFQDGRHRFALARVLDLPLIPVLVTVRHARWVDLRRRVVEYARGQGGAVYAPLLHPDLSDIPSQHGHRRFEMIHSRLPVRGGTLLDLGAHWGYFCHRFEAHGFQCTAVERDPEHVDLLRRLRIAEDRGFDVFGGSMFDYPVDKPVDVVLALSVFHHFLKTREAYGQLVRLLERLNASTMVFEPHEPRSPQMAGAYLDLDPARFVDLVLSHSRFRQAALLGESESGRPVYLLTR
jgi:hypothetical protein